MTGEDLRAAFAIPAALALPALAIARHLGDALPKPDRWLAATAIAPLALGLPTLGLYAVGVPLGASFWLVSFVALVLAMWPTPARAPDRAPEPFPLRAVVAAALAVAALIALPALVIPYVRMWSDAWFHAGVAIEIARRGLPPTDPNFAGIPLYYPWFFHGLVATLAEAARVSPFHPQAMLNAWSAALLVFAGARVGARLAGEGRVTVGVALLAGLVVVFGLNPIGGPLWFVRAFVGETQALGPAWRELAGTNGAMQSLVVGFHPVNSSILNRLWTGTALTPAIAVSLALLASVMAALARPGFTSGLLVLGVAATLLAFHPAFGALALLAVGAGLVAAAATSIGRMRVAPLALLVVLGAAMVLAYPYVRACSPPGTMTPVRLAPFVPNLWAMALGVGPWWLLLPFALPLAWRAGSAGRVALVAASVAAFMAVGLMLPEKNSQKIPFLAWVLLAPLFACGLRELVRRLRLPGWTVAAVALALCVPTSLLYTLGVMRESRSPGALVRGYAPGVANLPLETPGEAAADRKLRENYPLETIVIESRRASVNEPSTVLAERRVFCGSLDVYLGNHFGGAAWGREPGRPATRPGDATESEVLPPAVAMIREEFMVRRGIVDALFSGVELTPAQRDYLSAFKAPVVMIVRLAETPEWVWELFEQDPDWSTQFQNDEIRLYRWYGFEEE
ncbi:MAG: hypothetical protein HOP12_04205 [Candidatus Eisenbacteria bacterium]|uniref:Uncharacterized protein n=1 Tax=Eiseniibacteriota bacterium TaxID=2212470 RepID=A0A849SFU3_UNCEI|nr:hypothetical protein [Candidatus Eisenbacteria bacterium]